MKKFALLLAVALPMAFASCGDDNDASFTLSQSSVELNYKGNTTLTASEKNVTWGSSDEFVATVSDNGKIEAKHVGTATITATKNGETATCKVTVVPTNNQFVMPYMTWKASAAQIESAFNGFQKGSNSTDNELVYYTNAANYTLPGYLYRLNATGYTGLYQSQLLVETTDQVSVYNWMEQYYNEVSTDDDEDFIYADNSGKEVAALGAIIDDDTYETLGWAAIWTAPDYTGTRGVSMIKEAKAAALKVLKK